ncbi:Uncharacterised protein [uncultured archaeon]|nr:Uncharacterised protein [uncultured archaeon]
MAKKQFETGCCPRFNPKPWQGTIHKWKNKLFLKDKVRCFFYIPLNINDIMKKNIALMGKAGAKNRESIMLTDYTSLFSYDIYIAVDRKVPGAKMATISGTFLSRAFNGGYSKSGQFSKEMHEYVKSKGKRLKKLYFSYTTCPACAKAYGENWIVLFAKI